MWKLACDVHVVIILKITYYWWLLVKAKSLAFKRSRASGRNMHAEDEDVKIAG